MNGDSPLFTETQRFISRRVGGLIIIISLLFAAYYVRTHDLNWQERLSVLVLVLIVYFFNMLELTVKVYEDSIDIRFKPIARKTLHVSQILGAESRTYRPMVEYGGWGVRWGKRGLAYNVIGNRGVQVELRNDISILIGSKRAEELEGAIKKVISG